MHIVGMKHIKVLATNLVAPLKGGGCIFVFDNSH